MRHRGGSGRGVEGGAHEADLGAVHGRVLRHGIEEPRRAGLLRAEHHQHVDAGVERYELLRRGLLRRGAPRHVSVRHRRRRHQPERAELLQHARQPVMLGVLGVLCVLRSRNARRRWLEAAGDGRATWHSTRGERNARRVALLWLPWCRRSKHVCGKTRGREHGAGAGAAGRTAAGLVDGSWPTGEPHRHATGPRCDTGGRADLQHEDASAAMSSA